MPLHQFAQTLVMRARDVGHDGKAHAAKSYLRELMDLAEGMK